MLSSTYFLVAASVSSVGVNNLTIFFIVHVKIISHII